MKPSNNEYGLNPNQEAFCQNYVKSGNATQSYLQVYGSQLSYDTAASNASTLMKNPKVKARISQLQAQISTKTLLTMEEALEIITEMVRGETEEEVVVIEGTGEGTSKARIKKKKISAKDRVSALDKFYKVQGAYQPDTNINVTPVVITGSEKLED